MRWSRGSSWEAGLRPRGLAVLLLLAGSVAGAEDSSGRLFRAGADRSDVTPDLGAPMPTGFGPLLATHVHDPLYVRSLVLDDGATRVALIVVDAGDLPRAITDAAKQRITKQTGLARDQVVIAATHTHSGGPIFRMSGPKFSQWQDLDGYIESDEPLNSYQQRVIQRLADSVQNAMARLEPARVGWGTGQVPDQVFSRRWRVRSEQLRRNPYGGVDEVRMNPPVASPELIEPAGPTDPEVSFLSVQARDGRPLALLANYSLHYIGYGERTAFSADYFGMFADRIGELLGANGGDPPFVGIMSNGTSGDVIGRDARQKIELEPPYVKMRRVANIVAAEVYRAYQSVEHRDWVKLDARYEELPLQPRRPTPEMLAYAQNVLAAPPDGRVAWHPLEQVYAEVVLHAQRAPKQLWVPVQALRIGELGIAALPVEVFAEMGLELKARSPFAQTFTMSLANGWYGYMPTEKQHELGGYETWLGINRLEKTAATKMLSALLRMFASMPEEPSSSIPSKRPLP